MSLRCHAHSAAAGEVAKVAKGREGGKGVAKEQEFHAESTKVRCGR
jgi:hypothetical protein